MPNDSKCTRARFCWLVTQIGGLALASLCWLWLAPWTALYAQDNFPAPRTKHVSDYANVITPADEMQIQENLAALETQTGIEATVVTIETITTYSADGLAIEALATRWFNAWGIGDATKNNGALLLVAVNDRKLRIELGKGYGPQYDGRMQRIIDEEIVPAFQARDYSTGIRRGTNTLARMLGSDNFRPPTPVAANPPTRTAANLTNQATRAGRLEPTPRQPTTRQPNLPSPASHWYDSTLLQVAMGGGLAAAVGFALREYRRRRPRICPQCRTPMVLLDEDADDALLDDGQKREEGLGAVDYDVWKCPGCGRHDFNRYPAWFTTYGQCPRCQYRTMNTNSTIVEQPTRYSTGQKRIDQQCQHCDYTHSEIMILPVLPEETNTTSSNNSTSSSDTTFGGGSSTGGGASGKW